MQILKQFGIFLCCLTLTLFVLIIYTVYQSYYDIEEIQMVINLNKFSEKHENDLRSKYSMPITGEDINTEDLDGEINSGNIYKFKIPAKGEEHIIFLETSCAVNETYRDNIEPRLLLNPQQACAIESAARANPDSLVYLFYTCPLDESSVARSSDLVQQVFHYPNVHVWHQNMTSFFHGTPLAEFYKSGQMKTSSYPASHSSDVLRFLVLWKFGGTYLDLDFIVRRPLSPLGTDYACAEDLNYIASGAMSFSTSQIGREMASKCVEEMRTNFRGDVWNHNGPGLITRVLKEHCRVNQTAQMSRAACVGFTVQPSTVYYPIMYKYLLFYDERQSSATMQKIEQSYAVHLWNSLVTFQGGDVTIRKGSKQPIVLLLREFCPIAYKYTNEPM